MTPMTEDDLTQAVLDRLTTAQDPRFAQVMGSLIKHLHAFIRDVDLKPDEWMAGIQFLTAVGQACDDKRQEFILLSDTLGVSMLVDAINNRKPSGASESTVLGPFHLADAPELPMGANICLDQKGEAYRPRRRPERLEQADFAGLLHGDGDEGAHDHEGGDHADDGKQQRAVNQRACAKHAPPHAPRIPF